LITGLIENGYYQNNPTFKHIQVNYIFKCKNESDNCIKNIEENKHNNINLNKFGYYEGNFWVYTDMNIIYFSNGISIGINDNYVRTGVIIK
jgi:hypothetical protein